MNAKIRETAKWIVLVVLGVALAALPQFFHLKPDDHPHWIRVLAVLEKVGDALIIASILGIFVDLRAKTEVIREVVRDVSSHIIGRHLPPPVREEINHYLLAEFVRPMWELTYTLTDSASTKAVVQLEIRSQFDIDNMMSSARPYTYTCEVTDSQLDGSLGSRMISGGISGDKGGFEVTRAEIDAIPDVCGVKIFTRTIDIPPKSVGMRPYRSTMETSQYLPENYAFPMICAGIASNVKVDFYYPKDKFELDLDLSSSSDNRVWRTEMAHGSSWMIHKPVLPGQCVITRWKRRTTAGTSSKDVSSTPATPTSPSR